MAEYTLAPDGHGDLTLWDDRRAMIRKCDVPEDVWALILTGAAAEQGHGLVISDEAMAEWRRLLRARHAALLEEGRRLASDRDDLIARGVDPAELPIPLAPMEPPQ
jgi:hypothetical protein